MEAIEGNNPEQEFADKIMPIIKRLEKEHLDLELCRGKGITLEKNEFVGDRISEIEKEIGQLKSVKNK